MPATKVTGNPEEDILEGDHQLLAAFRAGAAGSLEPGAVLLAAGVAAQRIYQLRTGLAYRCREVVDGRRAIVEIFVPGDVVGLEAVLGQRGQGAVAVAAPVRYWAVEAAAIRRMMQESPAVALRVTALSIEAQQRAVRLAANIARLDAPERVARMLIDLYDRMRRGGLIHRLTFNLRLTQQQIGDHLGLSGVHVNRVLRWLARERIAFVERQVVIINDLPRLRALARGEWAPARHRRAAAAAVSAPAAEAAPPSG
jgi:CRP/FNR family transcriptional regulator, anaerobic regulatory protein